MIPDFTDIAGAAPTVRKQAARRAVMADRTRDSKLAQTELELITILTSARWPLSADALARKSGYGRTTVVRVLANLPDEVRITQDQWDTRRYLYELWRCDCSERRDYDNERIVTHCDDHCPRVIAGDWDSCRGC
jgi:hypothetical protein